MRDWLYGVTQTRPPGNKYTIVPAWYEAEDILSMDHLVNWPQSMGGAGITPGIGQWKNVKAIYPMHNDKVNQALLRGLSKKLLLGIEDLDKIRDLFGSKVCEPHSSHTAISRKYLLIICCHVIGFILLCIWPIIFGFSHLPSHYWSLHLAVASQILHRLYNSDCCLVHCLSRVLESPRSRPECSLAGEGSKQNEDKQTRIQV